jgi:predicted ATPase
MLLKRLKVSGLLSFGPSGVDLPLRPLNVFIGANGSGKSNLLEVLALLRATTKKLSEPIASAGGIREWLWKGPASPSNAIIEMTATFPEDLVGFVDALRHILVIREEGLRFELADEQIENEIVDGAEGLPNFHYRYQRGHPVLRDWNNVERKLKAEQLAREDSILAQVKDPERYPALALLQSAYANILLYRSWSFGPTAALRREQSTHGRSDQLSDGGENLALVLSSIRPKVRRELTASLKKIYDGIEDWDFTIQAGTVQLFLEEKGGRQIPATRLSDGTLRYLCLLAILLHPEPPPIVAIEEPELGLHPDVIPHVAELLVKASARTQLFVTTHSRMLVDALGDDPESVIVCSKENGESRMERLDAEHLREWLGHYSLGDLWSKGEIGGNRW